MAFWLKLRELSQIPPQLKLVEMLSPENSSIFGFLYTHIYIYLYIYMCIYIYTYIPEAY